MPRICVWKGNLIKLFSKMLADKNGAYGACKIKNESETCYGQDNHGWASTEKNSNLRAAIERTVRNSLSEKVKEDIYLSFQHFMKDEGPITCSKVKGLILQTLKIVTTANSGSEKSLKIESSADEYNSANAHLNSEATLNVNSNREYGDEDIISRKKRRVADQIQGPTYQAPHTSLIKGGTLSQQSTGSVGTHSKAQPNLIGDNARPDLYATVFDHQQGKSNKEIPHSSKGEAPILKERLDEKCEEEGNSHVQSFPENSKGEALLRINCVQSFPENSTYNQNLLCFLLLHA